MKKRKSIFAFSNAAHNMQFCMLQLSSCVTNRRAERTLYCKQANKIRIICHLVDYGPITHGTEYCTHDPQHSV